MSMRGIDPHLVHTDVREVLAGSPQAYGLPDGWCARLESHGRGRVGGVIQKHILYHFPTPHHWPHVLQHLRPGTMHKAI
jgi:hypothetical protein